MPLTSSAALYSSSNHEKTQNKFNKVKNDGWGTSKRGVALMSSTMIFFVSGFKAHLVNFKINLCGAQNGFRAQVYCCGHYPSAAPDGSRNQSATHQCYVLDASTAT